MDKCLICGNDKFARYAGGVYGKDISVCGKCGLVFTDPQPEPVELLKRYGEGYYAHWISDRQRKAREKLWERRVKVVRKIRGSGKLLDVGCGEGLFLHTAQKHGYEVSGIEISEYAAKYARDKFGLEVRNTSLLESGFADNTFDIITLWHVLEHLPSPGKELEKARRLLKPGGCLIAAVPNVDDLLGQAFYKALKGKYFEIYSTDSKEPHLYHFSTTTLRRLLENSGFEIRKITADFAQVDPYMRIVEYVSYFAAKLVRRDIYLAILAVGRK